MSKHPSKGSRSSRGGKKGSKSGKRGSRSITDNNPITKKVSLTLYEAMQIGMVSDSDVKEFALLYAKTEGLVV